MSPQDRDQVLKQLVNALSATGDDALTKAAAEGIPERDDVIAWVERCKRLVLTQRDASALRSELPALIERLEGLVSGVVPVGVDAERVALEFAAQLPGIRALLAEDVEAAFEGDPAAKSFAETPRKRLQSKCEPTSAVRLAGCDAVAEDSVACPQKKRRPDDATRVGLNAVPASSAVSSVPVVSSVPAATGEPEREAARMVKISACASSSSSGHSVADGCLFLMRRGPIRLSILCADTDAIQNIYR